MLLISGSLRSASTDTAVLRTAQEVSPPSLALSLYTGVSGLPHFNPDDDGPAVPAAVEDLRAAIRTADAVLVSTPEYAGDLPGSFKNALDWAVGDDHPRSLNGKPVAWINCSPRGAADAHAALRRVLGYLGATILEAACIHLPVGREAVGPDGVIADPGVRRSLTDVLARIADAI